MTPKHLEQAEYELEKATAALDRIRSAETLPAVERGWGDFVSAVGTLYNKLHAGSLLHSSNAGWMGKKRGERDADPVLRYVHFARNANTHGIIDLSDQLQATALYGSRDISGVEVGQLHLTKEGVERLAAASGGALIAKTTPVFLCDTVTNKIRGKNVSCPPPDFTAIYGGMLTFNHRAPFPWRVAEEALKRVNALMTEARNLETIST